ncbi:MAG TPA: glycosyltransferase family 4 protein [Acidimicrobiales bacterium]|nr:glycosyltransferase family 4 protein [Acidimicrobiales bacterium]
MRVLVVHNRYSSRTPSGENMAVDDEARWLAEAGVDVVRHLVSNDAMVDVGPLARVRDGIGAVWSVPAGRRFEQVLDQARPDVVHVHNLFPLLTASVPAAAARRGVPTVWTVHNRRVACVAGGNFRDGHPCHECRRGWRVPGIVHSCYAGSRSASALVTAATTVFRREAARDRLVPVAISESMADWLAGTGAFPRDAVRVKYNGVASPVGPVPPAAGQRGFLCVGRLSAYKGVRLLLDAWARTDVDAELVIVGDGDLGPEVAAAAARDPRVRWAGHLPAEGVAEELRAARVAVVPALWDEPFGRTAAEALAYGRPVITTGRGALREIVDDSTGWVVEATVDALAAALGAAAVDDEDVAARSRAADARHAARFSPEVTTEVLVRLYKEVRDQG